MAYEPIITASIVAREGHGKTEFLKSLPKPCDIFHIDPNTEEVFEQAFENGKLDRDDVRLHKVSFPSVLMKQRDDIKEICERALQETFIDPLAAALESNARAIGFDTATELYELVLMAKHGKTVQIMQDLRTISNYEYKGVLREIQRCGKHCVLVHRARDHYETKRVNTKMGVEERREAVDGVYEREGFSKTGYAVNVEAYITHQPGRSEKVAAQYGMRVAKATPRPALKTADSDTTEFWNYDDPAWWFGLEKIGEKKVRRVSFSYLATKVYPNTSVEDWL